MTDPDIGSDPDFAEEHSRPTFADEPSTEAPDESVPTGYGGAGGMDLNVPGRWRTPLRRMLPNRQRRRRDRT